jgi:hypothetical protein
MKRLIIGSLVFLFIAACASSHVLTGTARPEIDPSQVKIYSHPPANFEEVALLTATSASSWAVTEQGQTNVVIEGLKKEAAKLGANGVLITDLGSEQAGGVGINSSQMYGNTYGNTTYASGTGTTYFASHSHKSGQAVAIYVTNSRPPTQSSPNSEAESKSKSIQGCIDVCIANTSRTPEQCFDSCVD